MKIRASTAQSVLCALFLSLQLIACNKQVSQTTGRSASADAKAMAGAPDTLKVPIISATAVANTDGPETLKVPIVTAP